MQGQGPGVYFRLSSQESNFTEMWNCYFTVYRNAGLQKMFSLSGTIKSNGQNFLSYVHEAHITTPQVGYIIAWSPYDSRVSGRGHFDALWCNLHLYLNLFCVNIIFLNFLVLNIFCGVKFFSGTCGPMVLWIL